MVPIPLEGNQTPLPGGMHCVPAGTSSGGGGSISLSILIDFILQRTYHELNVLSELLPRKTDMERKIEIVQFASRTRQLFVRLLALVKWATSATKVDKCAIIMQFLDKQSMLFVETADMLARMARETLVHARLPNFHLPCAVEILTTGTYMRLPTCIKERIVPPDPISPQEKKATLLRLNQIIQHRLVTSSDLPPQMKDIAIENGRVTFIVDHEFEVALTVMGDSPGLPWRLLDISVLVEDKETGDGKPLVHPMQVHFIHQLIQSRLIDNPKPLHDLYSVLHSFCQSLQLEVLHSQVIRLCSERLGNYLQVEYVPGNNLTLYYWRDLHRGETAAEVGYRLIVQVHSSDHTRPLHIQHTPQLSSKEAQQTDQAFKSDQLSIEKLLVHTVYIRTKQRLNELKLDIQKRLPSAECNVVGSPAVLHVPILHPCLRSEELLIAIDTHKGTFLTHVPQYEPPMIGEIQQSLNGDRLKFNALISELRFWIILRRCEKTLQPLPVMITDSLPLIHADDHPVSQLAKHRLFVKLCRHVNCYLIVELKEKPDSPHEVQLNFHLLIVKPVALEEESSGTSDLPHSFLSPVSLVQFDCFIVTHGPFTIVDVDQPEKCFGKRKYNKGGGHSMESSSKRSKPPAYFIPELAHIVAMCDERLPFCCFVEELNRRGICNQGVQVEADGACLAIKIVQMPDVEGVNAETMDHLRHNVLSCGIRMQSKGTRGWLVEYIICHCPITSLNSREQGSRRLVYFLFDLLSAEKISQTVDEFISEWKSIAHLYQCVLAYGNCISPVADVRAYPYKRLILGYGPNKANTVTILWHSLEKRFHLTFGVTGITASATNPHSLVALQLKHHFNTHKSIGQLVQMLHDTYSPLNSISKLSATPIIGASNTRLSMPVQSFTISPQSPTHVRISFRNIIYCLDVHFHRECLVAVRDGAYSLFDKSKVIEEFMPTPGLKSFLSKFVDDSGTQVRRRSQSEDDNPPSPISTIDPLDSFMSSHVKPSSPAQRAQEAALRFHHPLTPPPGSNPHTPASPHMSAFSQAYTASPVAAFQLASPPSLQGNINPSPSMLHMGTPSPGTLLTANSPGNLHVPSPGSFLPTPSPSQVHMPSPAGGFMSSQGHPEGGSPYPSSQSGASLSMSSPAASQWPGSPSVPRPSPVGRSLGTAQSPGGHPALHSPQNDHKMLGGYWQGGGSGSHLLRIIPQRSWAASIPTLLTHEAFDMLCSPAPMMGMPASQGGSVCSPLERFLSCVHVRRILQRLLQNEDNLTSLPCNEQGVVLFKVENFHCRVHQNNTHLPVLQLKLTETPEHKDQWSPEELQILERFFDTKVVCSPYKPNALLSFARILTAPTRVLKDCIQIMRLEMFPDRNAKWLIQWCLTIPQASSIGPVGTPSFLVVKTKFLFFLQLTRQMFAPGMEPFFLVLPLVHDIMSNATQLAERHELASSSPHVVVINTLKRFAEFNPNPSECSIFPSVRELVTNLVIPH